MGRMRARGVALVLNEAKALGEAIGLSEGLCSAGDWLATTPQGLPAFAGAFVDRESETGKSRGGLPPKKRVKHQN